MRRAPIISALIILTVPVLVMANTDNLIFNGGFEVPQVPRGVDYIHLGEYPSGEHPPLPGWDSYSYYKGVVLFNSYSYEPLNPVPEGSQGVQIEVGGDWISQSFATKSGQSYELSFYLSAYSLTGSHEADLTVTIGSDSEPDLVSVDLVGDGDAGYVRHSVDFTAKDSETTLTFINAADPLGVWWNYPQIDNVVVTATLITVAIDIKPGSSPNSINRKSRGKIPVAILSTENFDAPNMVDHDSLTFGHTGEEQSLAFCNISSQDINGDGLGDLMCHFYTKVTDFHIDDIKGLLRGKTVDGTPIMGSDTVNIVH